MNRPADLLNRLLRRPVMSRRRPFIRRDSRWADLLNRLLRRPVWRSYERTVLADKPVEFWRLW